VKLYYYAALGRPMVVTPGPSVVETLVGRGAAITARSRRHFVDRVRAVLEEPSFADRLGRSARETAEEFIWTDRVSSFENVVRSRERIGGRRWREP
jgi:glycosyltransferase involved in cell wall biosynthesis